MKDVGNILGNVFDEEIDKQIKTRQNLLKNPSKDTKTILLYNSKTPWIKLSSSVDIDGSSNLAKDNILFGGTANIKTGMKKGFNNSYKRDPNIGIRPHPGIESVSITTLNRGSLKKCVINIKCYSLEDFQIIDKLYTRPGYSLLLEWGHSRYINNNGKLVDFGDFWNTMPFNFFYNPQVTYGNSIYYGEDGSIGSNLDVLFRFIKQEKIKHQGNYGAFYGRIVNFDWSFNDNVYSIKVELISLGDVIESLKIGQATVNRYISDDTKEEDDDRPEIIKASENNLFIEFLFNCYIYQNQEITREKKKREANQTQSKIRDYINSLGFYQEGDIIQSQLIPNNQLTWDDGFKANYSFIRFGFLLKFIESQSNIFINNKKHKYIKIDTDEENNLCYANRLIEFNTNDSDQIPPKLRNLNFKEIIGDISLDYRICLFKSPKLKESKQKINSSGFSSGGASFNVNTNPQSDSIQPFILKEDQYDKMKEFNNKIMNIYINVDYLFKKWEELKDEEDNIVVFDYLDKVCSDLNSCLGDLPNMFPKIDDNRLYIVDERVQDYGNQPLTKKNPTPINIFGLGSFVESPSFNVKIPKNFSTMVTVGAQANFEPMNKDSFSFYKYNEGLNDRITRNKSLLSPSTTEENNFYVYLGNLYVKYTKLYKYLYDGESYVDKKKINDEMLTAFKSTALELYNKLLTLDLHLNKGSKKLSPFFLPFDLTLTMDGISGIRIYERFGIESNSASILPDTYKDPNSGEVNFEFLIQGVDEKIDGKSWKTTIKSLTIPKRK